MKDFDGWHPVKKSLNERENLPTFKKKEIWWCSTGVNLGTEQDGRNEIFEHPVLIVQKFNSRLFLGVPTSTQLKDFAYHYPISL